jgi:hypothetical protein
LKIDQIFSASLLAGALILSATACSAPSPAPEGNKAQTTATASPQVNSADSTEDTAKILKTVNGYYDFITSPDSKDKIKSAAADLTGRNATDEELQTFAKSFPEGFQYFDTSTSQLIQRAYTVMSVGSMSLQPDNVKISAPEESVNIDGDTATLNTTWISVTKNGKTYPVAAESTPDPSDLIQLVKKGDGSWVIVANNSLPKPTVP